MTENQKTVARYMDGFRKNDHAQILSCLTDDVVWDVPGAFSVRGKEAFDGQIEGEGFVAAPAIVVERVIEADDIVVAEGTVRTRKTDGTAVNLAMCDVFEMRGSRIQRLISYLMPIA
jgi:ketosteroid isomerase-like protein